MSEPSGQTEPPGVPSRRHRRVLLTLEGAMAVFGLGGGIMLMSGHGTPPVEVLDPLGLDGWFLPGVWLTASVAVPSAAATYLAWRGASSTPTAVLVASALLAVELLVQIPFLGVNGLQASMALIGGVTAGLAWHARDTWATAEGRSPVPGAEAAGTSVRGSAPRRNRGG